MTAISASMLASNFARMGEEACRMQAAGADFLHMDVMDGRFVPNISFGADVIRAVHAVCSLPLDVHLMVEDPDRYAETFVRAGATFLTVHAECTPHLQRALRHIRDLGARPGLALNPATPLDAVRYVLDDIDLLLSIHLNSDASAATNGLECYAAPPALAANAESVRFGRLVTAAFRDQLGLTLRGWDGVRYLYFDANNARVVAESSDTTVRSDPTFTVLEDCGCPAVLVEEGFITNASDRAALCTDSACEQAAELYYQCIIDFFE